MPDHKEPLVSLQFDHLLGRSYVPGSDHCYKLVRDFYRCNFGIELRDYAIPHDWNSDQLNLIEMIYEREGMEKVQDWTLKTLRPGDLLCVAVRASNPNHFLINVGGNQVLHHPLMQLSRVEMLRDFWRMSTCFVLRHPAVPDLTPVLPFTTIEELLRERYCPQVEA